MLVSSLGLKRVAFVGTGETVAPFAGYDSEAGILTGGLERKLLYWSPSKLTSVYGDQGSVYVLLQRSPTLKVRTDGSNDLTAYGELTLQTKKDEHVALIAAAGKAFGSVLVLASLDAANQDDAQLLLVHYGRHLTNDQDPAPGHRARCIYYNP